MALSAASISRKQLKPHPGVLRAGGLRSGRTGGGLADGGVDGAELKAVHAEAVEAAVGVDAALGAGVGGGALVHVRARLAVVLQSEAGEAPALWAAARGTR